MIYKNFIFDMGNVILDFSPDYLLSMHTQDIHVIKTLKQELFYTGLWQKMDNDEVSLEEMTSIVRGKVPQEMHQILDNFMKMWSLSLVTNLGMLELIERLKDSGYGIYLCSNAPSFFLDYKNHYPILDMFDGGVFSGEIGISKPQPEIFRYLLDKYNLNPKECFFVDDLSANIQGALNLGIDGYQYNGNLSLFENFLKNIGVI